MLDELVIMMNFVIIAYFIMLMIFVIATKIRVKALNFVMLSEAKYPQIQSAILVL